MTEVSHDEVRRLLGAYVLNAVPPDELATVRRHIVSCEECTAEADRLSQGMEAISLSVDPVVPPEGFSRGVLQRATGDHVPVAPMARGRRWSLAIALSGAIVVVAVGLLAGVALEARQSAEANRKAANALLEAAQGLELEGRTGVVAKVVPTEDGAVFVARGLEELADDRTYQLWFIRDEAPVSAGTFDVSGGVAVLRTSRPAGSLQAAAVTVEPIGGSEQPTTQPLIQSG